MIIVADFVPGLKRSLQGTGLRPAARQMVMHLVIAFTLHSGRMSGLQAAGVIRSEPRHRAQVSRCLLRPSFHRLDINSLLRQDLLQRESGQGLFIFIVDATLCSQAGLKTQNTYSTGNRQRRPHKGRRYGKQKHASKQCHSFTMGLLITPSGIRLPFSQPYYTKEYCQKKGLTHRTTAEAAADLIQKLPLPEGAEVVVLGDTAYEAHAVYQAWPSAATSGFFRVIRNASWPAASRGQKVRQRLEDWSSFSLQTVRFFPAQGKYVNYRRLSTHRIGPKVNPRTYYVHQESQNVHSVGEVCLIFSTTKAKLTQATPDDVKILMTNAVALSVQDVVELYSLRWQIEALF